MGSEQHSTAVRGSSAEPVSVGQTGSIETNDYDHGDGFDFSGDSSPYNINPAETIAEIIITGSGDVVMDVITIGGDTVPLPLNGGTGSFDRWNVDKIVFRDPNGTNAAVSGGWAGE
jgi:hypothetical protein